MKKRITLLIIAISIIGIILVSGFIIIKLNYNNKNDTPKGNKQDSYSISLEKINLYDKLKGYYDDSSDISAYKINGNYIYGNIINHYKNGDLFTTKSIFSYDYVNDTVEIYEFNYDYRILYYYIYNDNIYASLILRDTGIYSGYYYKWAIIKFDKTFKNAEVLKEGKTTNMFYVPVFYYSSKQNVLYAVAIDDISTSDENVDLLTRNLAIYKIDNNGITAVKEYTGNYKNKEGRMLCNIFDIQLYNDKLFYCTTDYNTIQEIRELDLSNYTDTVLRSYNLDDGWIISSFQRNDIGIFVGFASTVKSYAGKTTFYNFKTKELQEIDSEPIYNREPMLSNYVLFQSNSGWKAYNTIDNKFYDIKIDNYEDDYLYAIYRVLDNDKILIQGKKNIYIGTVRFE